MIIIADSGSTKTDWRIIQIGGKIIQLETIGLNPYYVGEKEIAEVFRNGVLDKIENEEMIEHIYFYGSGCSNESKKATIKNAFKKFLKTTNIQIEHDMLGAARAACKDESGIVAILGTGSNACLYDGKGIIEQRPSLGYVMGDEGGGVHLGKELLRSYFYGEMPTELKKSFEKYYSGISLEEVLRHTYDEPFANRYLASFARFVFHKKEDSFISSLITKCFDEFFREHILKFSDYEKYPLNIVGSIAFRFRNFIEFVADEYNVKMGNTLEKPIAGLTLFHTE